MDITIKLLWLKKHYKSLLPHTDLFPTTPSEMWHHEHAALVEILIERTQIWRLPIRNKCGNITLRTVAVSFVYQAYSHICFMQGILSS